MPGRTRTKSPEGHELAKIFLRTAEEQEALARDCRLSRLPEDIKTEILIASDLDSILDLILYLPKSTGSFKNVYFRRQAAIHNAILKERFSLEWTILFGFNNEIWDPLKRMPQKYHLQIETVVRSCSCEKLSFAWTKWPFNMVQVGNNAKQVSRVVRSTERRENNRTFQLIKCNAAVSGGLGFLALLQDVQDTVLPVRGMILDTWRKTTPIDKWQTETWVLPWAEKHLHGALLALWKIYITDSAYHQSRLCDSDEDVFTSTQHCHLTEEEQKTLIKLYRALICWYEDDKDHTTAGTLKDCPKEAEIFTKNLPLLMSEHRMSRA